MNIIENIFVDMWRVDFGAVGRLGGRAAPFFEDSWREFFVDAVRLAGDSFFVVNISEPYVRGMSLEKVYGVRKEDSIGVMDTVLNGPIGRKIVVSEDGGFAISIDNLEIAIIFDKYTVCDDIENIHADCEDYLSNIDKNCVEFIFYKMIFDYYFL